MAFTQADLDSINTAIASGAKRVRLNGREYEYQSVSQMLKARDAIQADLDAQDLTTPKRPKGFRFRTTKASIS